jgi:hypothetical protein
MIKWDEVQRETESMLEQVRHQMAMYRQRITELEAETTRLTGTIAVARRMQEGGYDTVLLPQASQPAIPGLPAEADTHGDGQLELTPVSPATATVRKPNWQKGVEAISDMPDLPPAIGLTRQPNKANTSYRVAALLQMEDRDMDIVEIIEAFQDRGWIDPGWAKPKDAITIAVKRSQKYGWTRQTGKYTYIYDPHGQDSSQQTSEGEHQSEGGEDLI